MAPIAAGNRVRIHYQGMFSDGKVFDSSWPNQPLEFTVGSDTMAPGVEKALLGMRAGESKIFTVLPQDAYGEYQHELKTQVERSEFPLDVDLCVGESIDVYSHDRRTRVRARVREISDSFVVLDRNHPLAGQHLTYRVQVVKIL